MAIPDTMEDHPGILVAEKKLGTMDGERISKPGEGPPPSFGACANAMAFQRECYFYEIYGY
jgi:hypothetical protein